MPKLLTELKLFTDTLSMRFTATYAYYYYATLDTGRVRRRMR